MAPCLDNKQTECAHELVPLVIVEGFLGGAGAALWGDFERFLNDDCGDKPRRVIFASVGPVSSLHDRACELYYALRGGIVDYGEEHSKTHMHSRYGRTYPNGLYSQWSPQHPLHFLGHSIGGSTILKLQYLLEIRYFHPENHPDMILSVNSISSPFRGTQLVYSLGERKDAAPSVRPLSVGSLIAKCVHLVTFFSPLLPRALDLHAESRSLSYRDLSFIAWLRQLWSSDWAESRDATPFDVTFEAADERQYNSEGRVHSGTYYRSHVARINPFLTDFKSAPVISFCATPLYLASLSMASFDFTTLQPRPSFLDNDSQSDPSVLSSSTSAPADVEPGLAFQALGIEYRENDGVVPLFSQWHPLPCIMTRCIHGVRLGSTQLEKPEPGIWYVSSEEKANHVSLVPFWMGTPQQKIFWESVGRWLRTIEM